MRIINLVVLPSSVTNEPMPTTTTLNERLNTVESAGWLNLDVVDLLRQQRTQNLAEKAIQTN